MPKHFTKIYPFLAFLYPESLVPEQRPKPAISIRDLDSFDDLKRVEAVEREVWQLSDLDTTPLTLTIASQAAGNIWLGAFDGEKLIGFAFGLLGLEHGRAIIHSHMLAVLAPYRNLHLGYKLKLAQRERALAMRINGIRISEMT